MAATKLAQAQQTTLNVLPPKTIPVHVFNIIYWVHWVNPNKQCDTDLFEEKQKNHVNVAD